MFRIKLLLAIVIFSVQSINVLKLMIIKEKVKMGVQVLVSDPREQEKIYHTYVIFSVNSVLLISVISGTSEFDLFLVSFARSLCLWSHIFYCLQ